MWTRVAGRPTQVLLPFQRTVRLLWLVLVAAARFRSGSTCAKKLVVDVIAMDSFVLWHIDITAQEFRCRHWYIRHKVRNCILCVCVGAQWERGRNVSAPSDSQAERIPHKCVVVLPIYGSSRD